MTWRRRDSDQGRGGDLFGLDAAGDDCEQRGAIRDVCLAKQTAAWSYNPSVRGVLSTSEDPAWLLHCLQA